MNGLGGLGSFGGGMGMMGASNTGAGSTGSSGMLNWGNRLRGMMGAGSTGAAGMSPMSNFGTFGHDTHPRFRDVGPEEDPSRHFFHDRRKEGRRPMPLHGTPRDGHGDSRTGLSMSTGRPEWYQTLDPYTVKGAEPN